VGGRLAGTGERQWAMTAEQAVAAVLKRAGAPNADALATEILTVLRGHGWRETPARRGPFDPFARRKPDPPSEEYRRRRAELWREFLEHSGKDPPAA
jgi:hypothetical protein